MKPVLFHVGDLPVYSYSVFVVLAYLVGLAYAWTAAVRRGYDPAQVVDASLYLFLGGIVGARLAFVAVAHERFTEHPLDTVKIWQGGLVFYGGLVGAVLAGMAFLKRRKLPIWDWSDLLAPVAMLALAVGRIGCFLNGCCYGKIAPGLAWGVTYPVSHPAHGLHQLPVHPTQIYASLSALFIFGALLLMQRRQRFPGQVFWTMVLMYACARFVIEFFRADPRGKIGPLSTSQALSVAAAVAAIVFMAVLFRRAGRPGKGEGGASRGPRENAP